MNEFARIVEKFMVKKQEDYNVSSFFFIEGDIADLCDTDVFILDPLIIETPNSCLVHTKNASIGEIKVGELCELVLQMGDTVHSVERFKGALMETGWQDAYP